MKPTAALALAMALSIPSLGFAQHHEMHGMEKNDMHHMDMNKCMSMTGEQHGNMPGMDMKNMDMQKCHQMMGMGDHGQQGKADKNAVHRTDAVVKAVDAEKKQVTLAHGPIKSLNWPSMTMVFSVKDKSLLNKLAVGKKVQAEFIKQGSDYVVTSLK